jgi:integrase
VTRTACALRHQWLKGQGRLSLHSPRHGYASLLIAQRLDVVFVSCQLGHANANVTLVVYALIEFRSPS